MVCHDVTDVGKEPPPLVKKTVVEQRNNHDREKSEDNSSQEEGELSPKNDARINNGHNAEAKTANRNSYSDDSRFLLLTCFPFIFF